MRNIIILMIVSLFSVYAFAEGRENVNYQVNEEPYEGYFVSAGENTPFVLLIHDWDGLTDYEVKRADMLKELGYTVFAIDLFGAGIRPEKVEDRRQHTGELYTDRQKMRDLMHGALREAEKLGANIANAVAMGYCFGGAAVLELARSGADMKGFVTFHGGLATPEGQDYSQTKGELLILHGTSDKAITMDQFSALAQELDNIGIAHEMITYGGADHAFTVFEGGRYNEKADRLSWDRFIDFLQEILNK